MVTRSDNIHRFHQTRNGAPSIFFQHIADIHGPYPVVKNVYNTTTYTNEEVHGSVCLSCNVDWPCKTFEILEDWKANSAGNQGEVQQPF